MLRVNRLASAVCLCLALISGSALRSEAGIYDAWAKSCKITFSGYAGGATLTNFPALVVLSTNIAGFSYADFNVNGSDLRFESSTGAALPYEIDTWNSTGMSYVWVSVPLLASSADYVTAYWKNTSATAPTNASQTWDSINSGVYHFSENVTDNAVAAGAYKDATAHARHADQNYTDKYAGGAIGRAVYSSGTDAGSGNQRTVTVPGTILSTNAWSKELFYRRDNSGVVFSILNGSPAGSSFIGVAAAGTPGAVFTGNYDNTGTNAADSAAMQEMVWHHIVATYDANVNGGALRLYRNGVLVGSTNNVAPPVQATSFTLLNVGVGFGACPAEIDELPAATVARDANWVMASYKTQASNSTFQTYTMNTNGYTPLIVSGDSWLYHNDGTLPPGSWYAASYTNDTDWANGLAPMGYGEVVNTTLNYGGDVNNKWTTYYFRKHFNISSPGSVTGLVAQWRMDDGGAFYLNGTRVYLSPNMRDPIGNNTLTISNSEGPSQPWQEFTINPSLLVAGDNVLSIEVHQGTLGSSDLYMDMALTTVPYATTNQPGGYPENWTAYSDAAWADGDMVSNSMAIFTTNGPLGLVSGPMQTTSGQSLFAGNLTFTTSSILALAQFGAAPELLPGTDAYTEFYGKVGTSNRVGWSEGTMNIGISGLNSNKQYKTVLWVTRGATGGDPAYTNRLTDVVISSVDSFLNTSSTGTNTTIFQSTTPNDSTRVQADSLYGYVVRFEQVRPGADGTIMFALSPNGSMGLSNAYINAIKVVESAVTGGGGDADADGMDDAWEVTYFGSTSATNGGTNQDYDGDGSSNYDEYMAGTLPNNSSSKLEFTSTITNAPGTVVFSWAGVNGKTYTVQSSTGLTSSVWSTLQSNIPGVSPTTVYTGTVSGTKRFMRVKVQ